MAPLSFLEDRIHRNLLHSFLLLGSNAGLAGLAGWLVAGAEGLLWAVLLMAGLLLFMPRLAPQSILKLYGAIPLSPAQAPALHAVRDLLCREANLSPPPALYYIPSRLLNAFAVGAPAGAGEPPALALTDGLLRALSLRELGAVMAHEMSHIIHNDMRVMAMADVAGRVTSAFSLMGQLLLLLHLPWLIMEDHPVPWLLIVLLLAAPTLSALLQLALSRSREVEADLEAVRLSQDPLGLASALSRMDAIQQPWFKRVLLPGRRDPNPSLLRTHPDNESRITRLQELASSQPFSPRLRQLFEAEHHRFPTRRNLRTPRWRPWGVWR